MEEGVFVAVERRFSVSGQDNFWDRGEGAKWVLAGINAKVYPTKEALKPQTMRAAEKCESSTFFTATSVKQNMDIIHEWMIARPSLAEGRRDASGGAAPR